MNKQSDRFQLESQLQWENPSQGVKRQIMGYDDSIMMVKVLFETGAVAALHQHIHSQVSYVASGKFEVQAGDQKMTLSVGDGCYFEPDILHCVTCIEQGVIMDVFSPVREDFLK
ncbi:MAG: cupin domain-containing protein [Rikenellaceae bacterium]